MRRLTLRFNPGRDVAMLNALLHTIIEEDLYDRQYIQAHTEDFEQLREHIRDYSPEKMAPLCGIDAATLRHVARTYARAERAIIFWGMGISQHIHGTDNARCLIALAMITGQIGRPGHRPASAARPEQCAGRLRRRADPDGLPRLSVGREPGGPHEIRGAVGHRARRQAPG